MPGLQPRWVALAAALAAAAVLIAFTRPLGADYANLDCQLRQPCSDAQPQIDALAAGEVSALWTRQGLLGPVSVALRAPVAAIGEGDRERYRLGSLACLLVLAAAALLVALEMSRRKRPFAAGALVAGLILVNPVTFRALALGHPEDVLGAGLVAAAGVFAVRGNARRTGAAAALAVANKLWAGLALAPLLLALPRRSWSRAAVALIVVLAVVYGPVILGAPDRFAEALADANKLGQVPGTAQASNLWWPFMSTAGYERLVGIQNGAAVFEPATSLVLEPPLGRLAHPLIVVVAVLLALAWARRPRRTVDVLLLLAVVFLMRCVLEPGNVSYYHLPFLTSLIAFEGLTRGWPVFGLLSAAGLQGISWISPYIHSDAGFASIYLAWALPTLAGLAIWLFRRPAEG